MIGVDGSRAMLDRAAAVVPGIEFREGELGALPVESASVDVTVCALALTHVPSLDAPLADLARVVRPGGCVVLSDFHPFMMLLGGTAFFVAADGRAGHVTSHFHPLSAYLDAFAEAGLHVVRCLEPCFGEAEVPLMAAGLMDVAPAALRAAIVGLPAALIWQLARE